MEPTPLRREVLPPRQAPSDPGGLANDLVDDLAGTQRKRAATWTLLLLMGSATAVAQLLEKLL